MYVILSASVPVSHVFDAPLLTRVVLLFWQEDLSDRNNGKQHAKKKTRKGFMGTLVGFALGCVASVGEKIRKKY